MSDHTNKTDDAALTEAISWALLLTVCWGFAIVDGAILLWNAPWARILSQLS